MQTGRVILSERAPYWATPLRRELAQGKIPLFQTRTTSQCRSAVLESPWCVVVAELWPDSAERILGDLDAMRREFPATRIVVLGRRGMEPYEWLAREAGAQYFACSPRRLGPIAEIARRHLAGEPERPRSVEQRVLATLPWKP